tara:strand:+ start:3135 stop:4040 length:906 start_codon:yes stop_codon:yes gene_type:complete
MDYRWVQLLILWALYYKEVHLALYSILVYMALSLVASTTNLRLLYLVLALAAVAIIVNEPEDTWFVTLTTTRVTSLVYSAMVFKILAEWEYLNIILNTRARLDVCFDVLRRAILNSILYIGFCLSLHYTAEVVELVEAENATITIRTSTIVTNHTCSNEVRIESQQVELLYDSPDISETCAWTIWVKHRINVLALLQLWVLYHLLFGIEYEHSWVQSRYRVLFVVMELIRVLLIFVAVSSWVDRIFEWYVVPLTSAVMLTVAWCLTAIKHASMLPVGRHYPLRTQIHSTGHYFQDTRGKYV